LGLIEVRFVSTCGPQARPFHHFKESYAMKSRISPARMITTGLLLALVSFAPLATQAMDADELIAKSLEATGGLDKIKAIESSVFTGKFLTQGMEFPFTMTQKRPLKMRIEAEIMGATMVQCFDGEKGWGINPMTGSTTAQPMSGMEEMSFRLQADMDGPLVDYADKGYTVEYLGEEDVEGTPAYKLKIDTNDGIVMNVFFDKEYFLTIKSSNTITVDENEFETQTYPSDYQEVEGILMPFSIETRSGDTVLNQVVMEKVAYGVEVDDSIFVMPEAPGVPDAPSAPEKEK
jgi:outer membrane lipoprotein-sorting protein